MMDGGMMDQTWPSMYRGDEHSAKRSMMTSCDEDEL
jgi:hypothetical protein